MSTNTDQNEAEVKEFSQTVHVAPTTGDDELVDEEENDTQPQSSEEENEPAQEEPDAEESQEEPAEEPDEEVADAPEAEPKPVAGETPRERALRLEATRLKGLLRDQRRDELFVQKPTTPELHEDTELEGYEPEQVKQFETLAKKLGFVKKDEIISQTSQERNNSEFETFMEAHPEYAPENDKDGALWSQFKSEFSLYNPPKDPKTLRKILQKVHSEIHGVQPAANLTKVNAAREKIKVASHTGASVGKAPRARTQAPSGLRTDAMKGFSDDELEEYGLI